MPSRKKTKSNPLADPSLRERVEEAAESIKMSPAQLLDALQKTLSPSEAQEHNGDVEDVTLDDIGRALTIQQNMLEDDEKREFWKKLTDIQQGALVAHLTHTGFAPTSIALAFGVSERTVREYWDQYSDRLGQRLQGIRLQTIVGNLQSRAEQLYEEARRTGKLNLAWKISMDHIKMMQDLGAVERAVHRSEVTHKLELTEAQEREYELAAELRQKRLKAQEEIKRIQADPVEAVEMEASRIEEEAGGE